MDIKLLYLYDETLISLLAEVALNYVDLRSFQTRLSVAEARLEAQKEMYDITRWRRQAGLTTQLDVEQAKYSLEQTRAQIPGLQTSLEQAKNRLAVLIEKHPGVLKDVENALVVYAKEQSRRQSTEGGLMLFCIIDWL